MRGASREAAEPCSRGVLLLPGGLERGSDGSSTAPPPPPPMRCSVDVVPRVLSPTRCCGEELAGRLRDLWDREGGGGETSGGIIAGFGARILAPFALFSGESVRRVHLTPGVSNFR